MGWGRSRRRLNGAVHIPVPVRQAMWALDGERVALRRPRPVDHHAFAATMDDDVVRINGWRPQHRDLSLQVILSSQAVDLLAWALIWSRETGSVVGSISVGNVDVRRSTCELGWWLGRAHRGRGYGTEAVTLALGAIHAAGIEHIRIGTAEDNAPVHRVAAKVGAVETSRSVHVLPNGTAVNGVWYVHRAPVPVPAAQPGDPPAARAMRFGARRRRH